VSNSDLKPTEPAAAESRPPEVAAAAAAELSTCWNRIGLYGDGSCPELRRFVHCRNCPVYSNAALQLLNRPMPPDYRQAWTKHFAVEKKRTAPGNISALVFRISAEWLALPTQALQEVAEPRRVHSLPHRQQGIVLGLANIRGELLLCISLGHLLGLDRLPSRERLRGVQHRLLVVAWDGSRLAFPVDEVLGTHRFDSQELKAPPATVAKSVPTYTQGILYWRERTVGVLDPNALFSTLNRSLT
jgi:chemotaxis-related protein WspD